MSKDLSLTLFEIGAIKTGSFTLKSGQVTPIYVDLRTIISFPDLLNEMAAGLSFKLNGLNFDLVCGVPYTAIPIATAYSLKTSTPMIMKRKEYKSYGTKRIVEGVFQEGQKCVVIEDIVTSGESILETIKSLEEAGLVVEEAICLIDREQGAKEYLKKQGYRLHSLYNLGDLLDHLAAQGKIEIEKVSEIKAYLKRHQFQEP